MRKFNLTGIRFPISKSELLEKHGSMPVLVEGGRVILLKELVELEMVENFESELELQFLLAKAYHRFQKQLFFLALTGQELLCNLYNLTSLLQEGFMPLLASLFYTF